MYSVLNHASFALSKTAFEREMPSRAKRRMSHPTEKSRQDFLLALGGVQPNNARKLRKASGTMPIVAICMTLVAP